MKTVADVLDELGVSYVQQGHHHCTAGWLQLDCGQCSPDSGKYRLGVHAGRGNASCWTCGPRKSYQAIAEVAGVSWAKVRELFKGVVDYGREEHVHSGKYTVPFSVGPLLGVHKKYLRGRGFDPKELERLWGVQGIGPDGKSWRWRLFCPVVAWGKPVSWVTRSVRDDGLRYLSAKEEWEAVPHKHVLYGLDYVRHSCVVVEGPTGCWRIGPGTVCTFGTRFEAEQVSLIAQVPRRYVMFDPEPQAMSQARRLCDLLSAFPGVTELVEMDAGTDPGSLSPKQVRQVRKLIS